MCLVNIENNFGFELFLNRVNQNLIESVKKIVNIELRVPLSLLFLLETIFINVRCNVYRIILFNLYKVK